VQQDLARPGVVERFVGQEQGAALRQLFAGVSAAWCVLLLVFDWKGWPRVVERSVKGGGAGSSAAAALCRCVSGAGRLRADDDKNMAHAHALGPAIL
jgi:hypothetical protein